jgi:hypothetical protein
MKLVMIVGERSCELVMWMSCVAMFYISKMVDHWTYENLKRSADARKKDIANMCEEKVNPQTKSLA